MFSSLLRKCGTLPPSYTAKTPVRFLRSMRFGGGLLCLAMAGAGVARADLSVSELKSLDLEELMEVEVTSVSRRPEPIYSTAGAVSVMSGKEVAQTGATTIADALRYVPGTQVARTDSHSWAVTVRGFNGLNANKLLVLMDGRSVYTPVFSGVLWDAQDTFLPDIDRIEIVRGPGATLWGSNAVNGVISVTTKDARYTQGGLLTVGGGTEENAFASVRYGGEVPGKFYYRVYAKTAHRDDVETRGPLATQPESDWRVTQGGFRIDGAISEKEGSLTLQGDYYDGSVGNSNGTRGPISGGNILVRATRHIDDKLTLTAQAYFDHIERALLGQHGEIRNTYDFDTHINYRPRENHDLVGGFNYRSSSDHTRPLGFTNFMPTERRIEIASMFLQDEIRWRDGRYGLVMGSKFEHHESVGWEVQPSIRGAIRHGRHTYWVSVSRAVRTPSRYDEDVVVPSLARPSTIGSRDFESEVVVAYEAGYRGQPFPGLTWDVSLFYNAYDKLRSYEPTQVGRPPRIIGNKLNANTYGGEISLTWQPVSRLRLHATYSYFGDDFSFDPGSRDSSIPGSSEANDPEHQATLRTVLQLPGNWEWSTAFRYVDSLPYPVQDGYFTADTRLVWRFGGRWELSLVGQNLVEPSHVEFGGTNSPRLIERGFYGSLTWQF